MILFTFEWLPTEWFTPQELSEEEEEDLSFDDVIIRSIRPVMEKLVRITHDHRPDTSELLQQAIPEEDIEAMIGPHSSDLSVHSLIRQPTNVACVVDDIMMDLRVISQDLDRRTDQPVVDRTIRVRMVHKHATETLTDPEPNRDDIHYYDYTTA